MVRCCALAEHAAALCQFVTQDLLVADMSDLRLDAAAAAVAAAKAAKKLPPVAAAGAGAAAEAAEGPGPGLWGEVSAQVAVKCGALTALARACSAEAVGGQVGATWAGGRVGWGERWEGRGAR